MAMDERTIQMSDGGKGDKARPLSIPKEEFDNRWETIFGKKNKEETKEKADEDRSNQVS